MSGPLPDRPNLTRDEEEFVRKLAGVYAPPEPTAAERVAFNAALEARVARRRARAPWRPMLAAAALAAVVAIFLFPRAVTIAPQGEGDAPEIASASPTTPESVILTSLRGDPPSAEEEAFPDDYLAIEDVFLGS